MSSVSVSDILKLAKIAYNLWDLGFSKAKNAGKLRCSVILHEA